MTTKRISRSRAKHLLGNLVQSQQLFRVSFLRRTDLKVNGELVAPAGSVRHMVCKGKLNLKPTKNWASKGGQLAFDPAKHDLLKVYTVEGRKGNDGRGNHWGFVCLRTVFEIVANNILYKVA